MFERLSFFAVFAGLCVSIPFHHEPLPISSPSTDPFYNIPWNISRYANGQIIHYRDATNAVSNLFYERININVSYEILYRTADSFGMPTATASTLLLPNSADLTKLVSYQVAEDASWINCAPSYIQGGGLNTSASDIANLLTSGWPVVIPNHEGPKAAYLANVNAAHAILDSFRAVTSSDSPVPIPGSATKVMWGYSGGSITSSAAAERLSSYAPEIEIAGAVIGGTAPNITNVVSSVNKGPFAGLIVSGIWGLAHEYAAMNALLQKDLKPETAAKFRTGERACLSTVVETFAFQNIFDFFYDAHDFFYANPHTNAILNENAMGWAHTPTIPMLVYKAIADELSPIADTDALIQHYCSQGANIQYFRDHDADHVALSIIGAPLALSWIADRMHGVPVSRGCATYENVTALLL